jgi:hypothetical protein
MFDGNLFFGKLWGSIPLYHYLLKELSNKVLNSISKNPKPPIKVFIIFIFIVMEGF